MSVITETTGRQIVRPYISGATQYQLTDIAIAIDETLAVHERMIADLQKQLDKSFEGMRSCNAGAAIAIKRWRDAEALAEERLEALLACAKFSTHLARELRLERITPPASLPPPPGEATNGPQQ